MVEVYVTSAEAEGPTTEELREKAGEKSPQTRAWEDVCLLISKMPWLFNTVLPLKAPTPLPGMQTERWALIFSYTVFGIVTILSLPALSLAVPVFFILPGWTVVLVYVGLTSLIALISAPTWGSFVLQSRVPLPEPPQFPRERWLFINGIATSHALLQGSIDIISATFKRPIIGVHNRSWGLIGDLLECMVQRSFRYNTLAVRISYEAIRDAMLDENLDKVVVIAHSQGGIITSLALVNLYATMPTQYFKKLEIYTFGSAASDFHNPMVDPSHLGSSTTPNAMAAANKSAMDMPKLSSRKPDPTYIEQHLVKYIEHYCNGHDMVPLWGVLWHIAKGTSSSYSGRVFRHENQSGHLFDQHYLESMLPLSKINDHDDPHMFLNHVCRMNTREAGVLTAATFGPNSKPENGEGLIVATVRDLSRLWRYVDGKSP